MTKPKAATLLTWYDRHRRALPWRALPGAASDPYAIWLSEVMCQQTTIAAVKSYYEAFLTKWPRVTDLAAAPVEDVMKAWAGLGYYSRARNLHACAQSVVRDHGGSFPDTEAELLKLPGIGPYTAAAIAAIAFDRRAVVVDGNVERVVSRLFTITTPMPRAKIEIRAAADRLTPQKRCGDFAQAMMDLGASLCSPRKPACALCPFMKTCAAFAQGTPETYPVKAQKAERPSRVGACFVLRRKDGAVLVRTRPPKGLLGGMTDFPGSDWTTSKSLKDEGTSSAPVDASWSHAGDIEHVFTHFALRLRVYIAPAAAGLRAPKGMRWVACDEMETEALPSVMRKVWTRASDAFDQPSSRRSRLQLAS